MVNIVRSDGPQVVPLPSEARDVAAYLRQAAVVVAASGMQTDRRDPQKGQVVPIGIVTDGSLVWPMEILYYYETYGDELSSELLANARRNGFQVPRLSEAEVQVVREQVDRESRIESTGEYSPLRGDGADPFG